MRLFDTPGADAAYDRWQDPPEPRGRENDVLRDECADLDARNRAEIRREKFETLIQNVEKTMSNWKLDFKVVRDGVELFEGDRRVATVYDPIDAGKLMEIMKMNSYLGKLTVDCLAVISDLQKLVHGENSERTVRFVTEANYLLGVLKKTPDVSVSAFSVDESKKKA